MKQWLKRYGSVIGGIGMVIMSGFLLKWWWSPPPADLTKERIAFVTGTSFPGVSGFLVFRHLHIMNLNGDGETNLGRFRGHNPSWSKDGTHVIYTDDEGLYLMNIKNKRRPELLLSGYLVDADWSPDETKILFLYDYTHTLSILDIDTGQVTQLTDGSARPNDPKWSPDGQKITFSWMRFNDEKHYVADIAILNADGTGFTLLTTDGDSLSPKWSSDGQQILFERRQNIYLMDADGTNVRALTNDHKSLFPTWSPDGRHILYVSQVNEECGPPDDDIPSFCTDELRIMDVDGANVRIIRKGENQRFIYPTWISGN